MRPIQISYLYQLYVFAQNICNSLDNELRNIVDGSDFLSENAQEFAQLLRNIIGAIRTQLQVSYSIDYFDLVNSLEQTNTRESIQDWKRKYKRLEQRLYFVSLVISELTPLIKYVRGATAEMNPWGVVAQVDRLCRNLDPQARVIIRPRWRYSYSYLPISYQVYQVSEIAKKADSNLGKAISDHLFPQGLANSPIFSSLAYPPIEADNILHMAIWGHELGHFVDNLGGLKAVQAQGKEITPKIYLSSEVARTIRIGVQSIKQNLKDRVDRFSISPAGEKVAEDREQNSYKRITKLILTYRDNWAAEIFADLFAVRMFGPSALFSLVEFSKPIEEWIDQTGPNHISIRLRMRLMLQAYQSWFGKDLPTSEISTSRTAADVLNNELRAITAWAFKSAEPTFPATHNGNDFFKIIYPFFYEKVIELYKRLKAQIELIYQRRSDCFLSRSDMGQVITAVQDLEVSVPPNFNLISAQSEYGTIENVANRILPLTVNAGWIYWLSKLRTKQIEKAGEVWDRTLIDDFQDINILLLKSVENAEAQRWYEHRRPYGNYRNTAMRGKPQPIIPLSTTGVLSHTEILQRLKSDLKILPILDPDTQVGTCSLDIRLGNTFIFTKYPTISKLDPSELESGSRSDLLQNKVYLPYGKAFVLHPRQFILATTLEYISMPENLMGLVIGRESWGRMGLIMVTTSKVIPGYKGCITLSLTNIGNAPIALYPLSRVGQIIFYPI